MKLVKITALIIAILMLAAIGCGCGSTSADVSSEAVSSENGGAVSSADTVSEEEIKPSEGAVAIDFTGYTVVKPRYSSSYAVQLEVDELIKTMKDKLGVEVTTVKDNTEVSNKEIVLSGSNREGVTAISDLESYSVSVTGGKVYLEGGSDRATMAAVNQFNKMIASGEKIADGLKKTGTYKEAEKSFSATTMKRVWGDDFDGTDIDTEKWGQMTLTASDIASEWSSKTYKVEGGQIFMYSSNATEDDLKKSPTKKYYCPYFLCSNGKMEFQYGIFEINAMIPFYKGNSSAFWFCSTEKTALGYTSEIDMVELLGSETSVVSNLHTWSAGHTSFDGAVKSNERNHTFESRGDVLRSEYHTYFLNWTEDFIDFGTDSEVYYHADLTAAGASQFKDQSKLDLDAFRLPVYIIISEFLYTPGRGYSNRGIDPGTEFFYLMKVDHCDIYQSDTVGRLKLM